MYCGNSSWEIGDNKLAKLISKAAHQAGCNRIRVSGTKIVCMSGVHESDMLQMDSIVLGFKLAMSLK